MHVKTQGFSTELCVFENIRASASQADAAPQRPLSCAPCEGLRVGHLSEWHLSALGDCYVGSLRRY